MCTYIHTYIHTSLHTYIHPCIHTYILAYIHTYIHTYPRACTHRMFGVCSCSGRGCSSGLRCLALCARSVAFVALAVEVQFSGKRPEQRRGGQFGGRGLRRRLCILLLRDDRGQSCLHHCSADHSGGSITDFVAQCRDPSRLKAKAYSGEPGSLGA